MAMAQKAGCLARLVTDFWNPWGILGQRLADNLGIPAATRMADRYHRDIPSSKISAFPHIGVRYQRARSKAQGDAERFRVYETFGKEFARKAVTRLNVAHDVFWGFSIASLETLRHERNNGVRTIVDQVDPGRVHYEIVRREEQAHSNLVITRDAVPETYFARMREEWEEATAVVVNSEWSKKALIQQGVQRSKISVIPVTFQPKYEPRVKNFRRPLRVLWLGTLSLGKGIAYAVDAARLLLTAPVSFTFAGPAEVKVDNLQLPSNCSYIGSVARSSVTRLYREHDIFLFPTLSDGFGLTQLEAAASGLPVISTDCCAEVVKDGVSGFIVTARDSQALAERILRFLDNKDLVSSMSEAAIARSYDFLPNHVWQMYQELLWPR